MSRAFAYEAVNRGEIPHIRIGKRILIPRSARDRCWNPRMPATPPLASELGSHYSRLVPGSPRPTNGDAEPKMTSTIRAGSPSRLQPASYMSAISPFGAPAPRLARRSAP
ncbi:MAG: helix-turn-helix domain-containing protein [Mycobacteriales bacterium]